MSCACACHRLAVESIEADCQCRHAPLVREPGAGPLNDEQTVARIKAGFGCMCRHEWLVDWGDPHCDGPLTRGGGGLCWTCKVIRRCGDRHFETNSYTVIGEAATLVDKIAVWNPEAIIRQPVDPASP